MKRPGSPRAPYLPEADAVLPALARFLGVPASMLDPLRDVVTNAVASAPVSDEEPTYPVLILLVGVKGSFRQVQTFQVEELVSHGYVVAALDQPFSAALVRFPDGREAAYDERWAPPHSAFMDAHIPYLARDVSFTLDQLASFDRADPNDILTGRLDLERPCSRSPQGKECHHRGRPEDDERLRVRRFTSRSVGPTDRRR